MSEDLSVFFEDEDFAVTATFGALTASVIFEAPTSDVLGGEMMSTDYAITYKAGNLASLARSSSVVITGHAIAAMNATYKVREITRHDDGAIMRATLSKT